MARQRKSPQRKKELEYTRDHFTFAKHVHAFRKEWPLKKALANRELRRKSDELLSRAKPGISVNDAEVVAGEITAAQLKRSVSRKRLHKRGTVAIGEKIKLKLEKRKESSGRRVSKHRKYDEAAADALSTLTSLDREKLTKFLKRAAKFFNGGDPIEWMRVSQSNDQLDRALWFLEQLKQGGAPYHEALWRNQQLCEALQQWREKANRILRKEAWPALQKTKEKKALKKKLNASRRSSGR